MKNRSHATASVLLGLLAPALLGSCGKAPDQAPPLIAAWEREALRVYRVELVLGEHPNFGALASGEVGLEADEYTTADGRRAVRAWMTGVEAQSYRAHGFEPRLYSPPSAVLPLGPIDPSSYPAGCDSQAGYGAYESTRYPAFDPTWTDATSTVRYAANGGVVATLQALDTTPASTADGVVYAPLSLPSVQNRPIPAIRYGKFAATGTPVPTVYFFAGYHAREWAAMSVAITVAEEIASLRTTDGAWKAALENAALVIVPVVNPDGYQYTRTTARAQRKNLSGDCPGGPRGVDLNRNHSFLRNERSDESADNGSCSEVYPGGPTAIQPETQAVERLIAPADGTSDAFGKRVIAASLQVHTAAAMLSFPQGMQSAPMVTTNEAVPNPDFKTYRELYGTWDHAAFADKSFLPARTFEDEHDHSSGYTFSGGLDMWVQYKSGPRALAVTAEFTGSTDGRSHYLECATNSAQNAALKGWVAQTEAQLLKMVQAAPSLVDGSYLSSNIALSTIQWSVSRRNPVVTSDSRGVYGRPSLFVSSPGAPTAATQALVTPTGSLTGTLRSQGRYHSVYDAPVGLSLPCRVTPELGGGKKLSAGCSTTINLCDPARLSAVGWTLHDAVFPKAGDPIPSGGSTYPSDGTRDCWWQPDEAALADADAVLSLPAGVAGPNDFRCDVSFSVDYVPSRYATTESMRLEGRVSDGSWSAVTWWPYRAPTSESRGRYDASGSGPRAYQYELWRRDGTGSEFRLVVPKGTAFGTYNKIRVLDPIAYCVVAQ